MFQFGIWRSKRLLINPNWVIAEQVPSVLHNFGQRNTSLTKFLLGWKYVIRSCQVLVVIFSFLFAGRLFWHSWLFSFRSEKFNRILIRLSSTSSLRRVTTHYHMSLNWFLYQKGVMVCVVYALPVAQTLGYSNHKEDNSGFITCSSANCYIQTWVLKMLFEVSLC